MVRLNVLRNRIRRSSQLTSNECSPGDFYYFAIKNSKGRHEGERTPLMLVTEFGYRLGSIVGFNLLMMSPQERNHVLTARERIKHIEGIERQVVEYRHLRKQMKSSPGVREYPNRRNVISGIRRISEEGIEQIRKDGLL